MVCSYFFLFSSGKSQTFRNTVTAAAIEAGKEVVILHQLTQTTNHPISIYHPEGEYLKGLVVLVR